MQRLVFGCLVLAGLAGVSVPVSAAPTLTSEEMFRVLDRNDDSRVTRSEYVGKARGEDAEKAKARFDRLDRDSSGSLTLTEYESRFKKKG
ncbi:MAG TPA: hypothetical protein VHY20_14620 [Pirellulales bacterium]|jgi:Ca2+-binding EF-hand superfamily protein|nr:hypothetical protein [Pirellulales bacterium]